MNTFQKIQHQEVVVANEDQKLIELKRQYVKEKAIFKKGEIVRFTFHEGVFGRFKMGVIKFIKYSDHRLPDHIEYVIQVITLEGHESKREPAYKYRTQNEIFKIQ